MNILISRILKKNNYDLYSPSIVLIKPCQGLFDGTVIGEENCHFKGEGLLVVLLNKAQVGCNIISMLADLLLVELLQLVPHAVEFDLKTIQVGFLPN